MRGGYVWPRFFGNYLVRADPMLVEGRRYGESAQVTGEPGVRASFPRAGLPRGQQKVLGFHGGLSVW